MASAGKGTGKTNQKGQGRQSQVACKLHCSLCSCENFIPSLWKSASVAEWSDSVAGLSILIPQLKNYTIVLGQSTLVSHSECSFRIKKLPSIVWKNFWQYKPHKKTSKRMSTSSFAAISAPLTSTSNHFELLRAGDLKFLAGPWANNVCEYLVHNRIILRSQNFHSQLFCWEAVSNFGGKVFVPYQ